MINPPDHLVVVRGGGDLGSGVIWRLHRVGFPVVVLELRRPLTVRRTVAFSTAVNDGQIDVEGVRGVRVDSTDEALSLAAPGTVPVFVSPELPPFARPLSVLIDARLAKRRLDTRPDQARLVVALGPGFSAGRDCHVVIETMRGHRLGRAIWEGSAIADTGVPGNVAGASTDRVLRAGADGQLGWSVAIGDIVERGQVVGTIGVTPVSTAISGTVRGLVHPGVVTEGLKIGDVDPRLDPGSVHTISDKALAVAGGTLEAVLVGLQRGTQ